MDERLSIDSLERAYTPAAPGWGYLKRRLVPPYKARSLLVSS